jgi:hypothetical protein
VRLRPPAVVRLERALAHEVLLRHDIGGRAPTGGWIRAGFPSGDGANAGPVAPGSWSLRAAARGRCPQTPTSIAEERPRPVTGTGGRNPGGWPHADSPACTTRPLRRVRHAGNAAPRRAGTSRRIVAGLWIRLLAWPSLRVGRQGSGARVDSAEGPRQPNRLPGPPQAADQRRRVARQPRCAGSTTVAGGRAHPVDTDVEPVSLAVHNRGASRLPVARDDDGKDSARAAGRSRPWGTQHGEEDRG